MAQDDVIPTFHNSGNDQQDILPGRGGMCRLGIGAKVLFVCRAWLKRLSAGIASSKLALQYYTKYVLFNVLLISQAEMIAELKTH